MKKTKFVSGLLSAVLVLSAFAVPAAAADVTQTNYGGTATVSYTNDSMWTATIPTYVAPVEAGQQDVSAYEVAVKDVIIGDNQQLAATIEYSGYVTETNGVKIPYQLYDSNGEEIQSGDTILSKSAGEPNTEAAITFGAALTDSPKYAGVYTDTATFAFTAKDKVYTLDEINADEHLFAIGETNPEFVVAKFNDDYSEVVIFKNGENSDGRMKMFAAQTSPMSSKAATLTQANIQTGVVSIGDFAFNGCTKLKNVNIADSVTSIYQAAFRKCSALTEINLPANVLFLEVMTEGYDVFSECSALTTINVSPDSQTFSSEDGVLFTKDKTVLRYCPEGKTGTYTIPNSVQEVYLLAFYDTRLESIVIPDSVNKIGNSALKKCRYLKTIEIGAGVTDLGANAFQSTSSLKAINVSSENQTFSSADGVLFNEDQTSLIKYPDAADRTSYTMPNTVIKLEQNSFKLLNCQLKSITISSALSDFDGALFSKLSNLQSVFVSENNQSFKSEDGVLFNKNKTELVYYPIDKEATKYIVPDSVTTIKASAFSFPNSYTGPNEVEIPTSVKTIEANNRFKSKCTIYGGSGSYAETWAKENGYTFIAQ